MNPYDSPSAPVGDVTATITAIPEEIKRKITGAWVAGVISGSVTLVAVAFALAGKPTLGFSAWELLDVGLIFGLAFGIYRKSRTCAILMLLYFIYAKYVLISEGGPIAGLFLAAIFVYYYALGIQGTFRFHQWLDTQRQASQAIP